MKTTATNRKLRLMITGIRNNTLIPRPEFQRRLVWTNKDKKRFLETVLNGYPFPEIYIASGTVDPMTAEGTEMLVDGQQRISTLYQYFVGSKDLALGKDVPAYKDLDQQQQKDFLEYDVVVRDLGVMTINDIKAVFERINATSYSLNAMEIHNARFGGEFKTFAEKVSQYHFFENHRIFSANEIRRMRDVSFILTFVITIMSTYFTREDELEAYLATYNDEFEEKEEIDRQIRKVIQFIEDCSFQEDSRVWKKSDLFTILVEVHRVLLKDKETMSPSIVGQRLKHFYTGVDNPETVAIDGLEDVWTKILTDYSKAAIQGTNDRGSRITRGEIISQVIHAGPLA